jgi:endonuclease YncB( thermonuclease family)
VARIGGKTVQCTVKDTDQYGRSVAVCAVGGDDVNAWMVSRGHAVAYRAYSKDYVPVRFSFPRRWAHRTAMQKLRIGKGWHGATENGP